VIVNERSDPQSLEITRIGSGATKRESVTIKVYIAQKYNALDIKIHSMGSTLFIDNLPKDFSNQELRKLFSNQGQVVDAYIPQILRRKVLGRFGFVEVQSRQQGESLIHETDGMILGHHVIKVQWARYPKRMRRTMNSWQPSIRGKQIWNWKWDYNRSKL